MWESELWLVWTVPAEGVGAIVGANAAVDDAVPEVSEIEIFLESHLTPPPRRMEKPIKSPFAAIESMQFLSSRGVKPPAAEAFAEPFSAKDVDVPLRTPSIDDARMRTLVQTLGIPEVNLRPLVNKVSAKIGSKSGIMENVGEETRNLIVPDTEESKG